MGAFLSSHLHRQVLASFIYILETLALIGFLITGPPLGIILVGGGIIVIGAVFFYILSLVGQKINRVEEKEEMEVKIEESANGSVQSEVTMIPTV